MGVRVCVTGGAGFIGSHLVDRLVAGGHEVVVLDNLETGRRENLAASLSRVRFLEGDLRSEADVARAVEGCEVVFHQAALASVPKSLERPRDFVQVNVTGTLNVLLAARDARVRRVVFASSSSVYGDTPSLPKVESMALAPRSPYAASKASGEALLAAFPASYGLETVSLRYFNVYGPRQAARSQYAAVVPAWTEGMIAGRSPVIHGDGQQTRDFTYVEDVVRANLLAATAKGAVGRAINVGGGRQVSILELARLIAASVGFAGQVVHDRPRTGDVRDSLADISLAQTLLGWSPLVSLPDGVRRYVAGLRTPS